MKKVLQQVTCLMISFLLVGCGTARSHEESNVDSSEQPTSSKQPEASSTPVTPSSQEPSSVPTSAGEHEHLWYEAWDKDETNHWHNCRVGGCTEKGSLAPHEYGEPEAVNPGTLSGSDQYTYANPMVRKCKVCGYYSGLEGTNILPELHFNFGETNSAGAPQEVNFMNIAKKNDLSRPEVEGTYTLVNAPEGMNFSKVPGTMKVRGNQTAGWRKKAFRIKFDKKRNVLGLNNGGKFKKWVLLADAKDTTLIRSAIGLYISREICKTENQIWVCDYTPVSVYLNDQYWGYYYLGEQKEVKDGELSQRIRLEENTGSDGVDIGYCFELDHYADGAGTDDSSEVKKGVDGDPTFRVNYSPSLSQGRPSGPLATGHVYTYTMLSDITDGPSNEHIQADYSRVDNEGKPQNGATKTSNSNQLSFIRDRMEQLYQVLYNASVNNTAKEIDANGNIVNTSKTIEEVIREYFDVDAWVDGLILHAFTIAPDLGYSSFYMSYDNTPTGDHKLRFDCPWDFDSNFGNRKNFYVDAQTDTYVENTYNTWLYQLYKLSFIKNLVKTKWNSLREGQVFENMFHMMRQYFADYDAEIHRNHYRWPENDAASMTYNNFDEIRDPYRDPSQYKQAETETINWCAKRVNYLEKKWGTGRADVNTNA